MDRRTILALVLIGLIIFFWDDYYRLIFPPPPEHPDSTLTMNDTSAVSAIAPSIKSLNKPSLEPVIEPLMNQARARAVPERFVTVETRDYRAVISTHGARLTRFTIKPSRRYFKREIDLLATGRKDYVGAMFWTMEGQIFTGDFNYEAVGLPEEDITVEVQPGHTRALTLRTYISESIWMDVVWTFSGDGYDFTYFIKGQGTENLWVRDNAEVYWRGGLVYTEPDINQDVYYSNAYLYFAGDVLERQKLNPKKTIPAAPLTGKALWGAIRTKYFMAALLPEGGNAAGGWMENRTDSLFTGKYPPNLLGAGLHIPISGNALSAPVRVYVGPLDDAILNRIDPSLKKAMTWGAGIPGLDAVIRPISKGVLWALKAMRTAIPNYGVCIIIFSILVKIIIWPLTKKSYQSMAAMQRIQPRMAELREKYKGDPQKLNQEMMQLYKAEGVNPLGGCLPILLQMPLLYALFIVFRSTIEFRRAPFALWINDLSLPDSILDLPFSIPMYGDHIAVLPIIMGLTTYFQSRQTMSDPNQKYTLYLMPVFLLFIFNNFPSGVTLYYTLFNVWTIVQQKYTPPPKPTAAAAAPASQPKQGRRKR